MESKIQQNELAYETETDSDREQTCGCQEGGGVGEGWFAKLGLADTNSEALK